MNSTTVHPRHTSPRRAREHAAIAARYQPSARELFPQLVERLHNSRPVIGEKHVVPVGAKPNRKGVLPTVAVPIFGAPTFRNRIVGGEHL